MERRRMLMAQTQGGGGLPADYQQVEYLGTTGTQYINLGYDNSGLNCELSFDLLVHGNTDHIVFGQYGKMTMVNIWPASRLQIRILGSNLGTIGNAPLVSEERAVWKFIHDGAKVEIYKGEQSVYSVNTAATSTDLYPILFGGNYRGSVQLYGAEITFNGEKHTLIPCYRKADNVAGIYDTANETFYTNNGSGNFTIGEPI